MALVDHVSRLTRPVRARVALPVAHALLRTRASDRFLVSYPRSGSTWVRAILAAIIDPAAGFEFDVFNRMIPGVSGRRLPHIARMRGPRLVHSHCGYRRDLRRVAYLVRDGRDVVVSYYHYTTAREGIDMPFETWLELYLRRGYGARWHDHVEGWLTKGREKLGADMLVVRFEDLRAGTEPKVREIARFLGVPAEPDAIGHAVRMAGLEKARQREDAESGGTRRRNARFYRSGAVGQWEAYRGGAAWRTFMEVSRRALSLAGYEE